MYNVSYNAISEYYLWPAPGVCDKMTHLTSLFDLTVTYVQNFEHFHNVFIPSSHVYSVSFFSSPSHVMGLACAECKAWASDWPTITWLGLEKKHTEYVIWLIITKQLRLANSLVYCNTSRNILSRKQESLTRKILKLNLNHFQKG